ncbi:hypothetical protein [Sphingopyxis sp.]|uniref:hypothetical protein n=1 Tax=Sphingopyxis sp. TaxID=1908224 RepID=UPI003BAC5BC4
MLHDRALLLDDRALPVAALTLPLTLALAALALPLALAVAALALLLALTVAAALALTVPAVAAAIAARRAFDLLNLLRLRRAFGALAFAALTVAVPIAAATDFGAARAALAATIAALGNLDTLAACLGGSGRNGGEDCRCDEQPSKRLLHLGILQCPTRHPADREDEVEITGRKMDRG